MDALPFTPDTKTGRTAQKLWESDLVGADDEHDAVHVGLGAHFLFHLPQPAVEGVETLPQADVINQQHPLTVLVELITHLTEKKKKSRWGQSFFLGQQHHLLAGFRHDESKLTSDPTPHLIEERMARHVKDVHFDLSVANLHSEHRTGLILKLNTTEENRTDGPA